MKAPCLHTAVLTAFLINSISVIPSQSWAQSFDHKPTASIITAESLMPRPGSSVYLSSGFDLAHFKGMVIDPNDPFKFDFIIHQGNLPPVQGQKKQEYTRLIKYFLAALAVPDTDQWVNLSPYEKDRIIAVDFAKTEMGRDLLAQDYLLKQLSSSLTNPETSLGRKFWDQVYERVYREFGSRDIPLNTFNKVWIVPDKAVLYEHGNMVYVISSHLKVMTESDYLAMKKHGHSQEADHKAKAISISNQVMRQVIIPSIEREVNEGRNFAPLRQVFSGMLLATWYKRALKESILTKLYANKSKLNGVDQDPGGNEKIYQAYLKAYKKGVYNMIREETDPVSRQMIPRKYFSGGTLGWTDPARQFQPGTQAAFADDVDQERSDLAMVSTKLKKFIAAAAILGASFIPQNLHAQTSGAAQAVISGQTIGVPLAWEPATNTPSSYRIYYGTTSRVYPNSVDVGNVLHASITGLTAGVKYYFVARSYYAGGQESTNSNEASAFAGYFESMKEGGAPLTFSLSAYTSGAAVTVTNTNPGLIKWSINNGVVTVTPISGMSGAATLIATVSGVPQSYFFTVNPMPAAVLSHMTRIQQSDGYHDALLASFSSAPADGLTLTVWHSPDLKQWSKVEDIITSGANTSYSIVNPYPSSSSSGFYKTALSAPATNSTASTVSTKGSFNLSNFQLVTTADGTVHSTFQLNKFPNGQAVAIQGTTNLSGGWSTIKTIYPNSTNQTGAVNMFIDIPIPNIGPQGFFRAVQVTNAYSASNQVAAVTHKRVFPNNFNNIVSGIIKPNKGGLKKNKFSNLDLKKEEGDAAQLTRFTRGGIDLAESNLDLEIRRDGKGMVLPVAQQDLDHIRMDGLVPEILDIKPFQGIPYNSIQADLKV